MKLSALIILGVAALCSAGFCRAPAQGLIGAPVSTQQNGNGGGTSSELPPFQKEINRRLCAALMTYPEVSDKPALVYMVIGTDGSVDSSELLFMQRTSSIEADFACLDAIMSSAPFYSLHLPGSWSSGYTFYDDDVDSFWKTSENKIVSNNALIVSLYFKTHPKQTGKVLLTRSIPPSVLYRYPGVFTGSELDSQQNIKALKMSMFDLKLEKQPGHFAQVVRNKKVIERYRDWENFEKNQRIATKTQIMDFEKMTNTKYAEIFEQ